MKVEAEVKLITIGRDFMVAAPAIQKRGYVVLEFTGKNGEKLQLDIAKGVALAVKDEIRRVTVSK